MDPPEHKKMTFPPPCSPCIGKTARIFRSSLAFGKKMLSSCFANSEETEMDS